MITLDRRSGAISYDPLTKAQQQRAWEHILRQLLIKDPEAVFRILRQIENENTAVER